MAATAEEQQAEVGEQEAEPPAQVDPTGRWTRTKEQLGKGAFKVVYKGFDEVEGIEVAWNQIRLNETVSSKEDRERLFAEVRVLKQLKHKNIMTFYDSWVENKGYTINFITELFTSGTLRQYRKRHKAVDPEVMKRWAWQILCGLVYLHGHTPPIIHRDLKCDNIFINGSDGVVKIGDLGLATMLRARTAPQSVLGTPEFMAPELYEEEYDDRVDVYSFGMCLLELATMEYPYSECRNAAQIYRKVTSGIRPAALSRVQSRELADCISFCIQPPAQRPRSRHVLKHHYFDSIRAEHASMRLKAEALCLPVPPPDAPAEQLAEYAGSAASSSVSRTSSAAGDIHQEPSMLLDAVPEEDEGSSTHEGSTRGAPADEPRPPAEAGERRDECEGLRDFKVKGRLAEDEHKLSLRLRIQQPDCAAKVVEFDFDLASDTATSVASEMVEEMSLSAGDAARIAAAIRDEILHLTRRAADGGLPPGAAAKSEASEQAPYTCGDSVASMAEGPPLSPTAAAHAPAPMVPGSHAATSSPPDSHMSFGSSPVGDAVMADAPLLRGPSLPTGLPKRPLLQRPSVLELHSLGRTGSSNHAAELEAAQQAKSGEPSSSVFAPPKEEARHLPLQKLLENLHEAESAALPAARPGEAPPRPAGAALTLPVAHLPGSASTPALHSPVRPGLPQPSSQLDLRRMSVDAAVSTAAWAAASPQRGGGAAVFSPRTEGGGASLDGGGGGPMLQLRPRSKADCEEAKEARRQAAQTSLRNMESASLAGLGAFGGPSRGCKQLPIKMMGWNKG